MLTSHGGGVMKTSRRVYVVNEKSKLEASGLRFLGCFKVRSKTLLLEALKFRASRKAGKDFGT